MEAWKTRLLYELESITYSKVPVIYLDEISFTKQAIQKKAWSARYTNLQINERDYYVPYWSVIAAVNETQGLVLAMSHDDAIDRYDFMDYLKALHRKMAR